MNSTTTEWEVDDGFSDRLKKAMSEKKVSQTQLAALIGVTQPVISYYLKGTAKPRLYKLQAMAFHLSVNYQWLKSGKGVMINYSGNLDQFIRTFSDRLLFLIWTSNMTVTELGDRIGITYSAIEGWINGSRNPNWENLKRLSEVTGVSIKWIVGNNRRYREALKKQLIPQRSIACNSVKTGFNFHISKVDYKRLSDDIKDHLERSFKVIIQK